MKDQEKTQKQLMSELAELRQRIAELEKSETERKRAEEEIRRRADELAALYDISLDVAAQLEIQELLQTVVERAIRLLNAKAGGVYLYHPAKREIELQLSYGLSKDYTGTRLALGEGVAGQVAQTGEPLMVDDYQRWEGRSPLWEGEALGGVLGVPLKRGDDLLGVLTIDHAPGKTFQEGDSRLATLFANQAAIAIENARLYEQAQARSAYLATLLQINATLRSTLPLSEVLETIVQGATEALGYVGSLITVPDATGDRLVFGAAWGGRFVDAAARLTGFKVDSFSLSLKARKTLSLKPT